LQPGSSKAKVFLDNVLALQAHPIEQKGKQFTLLL